jgi:hypothetical protein
MTSTARKVFADCRTVHCLLEMAALFALWRDRFKLREGRYKVDREPPKEEVL